MPAMKLKLPKTNSLPGMKVTALMLNGAIKLVDGLILMTPPTWYANCRCFFTGNTIYGAGRWISSVMVAQDAGTRREI